MFFLTTAKLSLIYINIFVVFYSQGSRLPICHTRSFGTTFALDFTKYLKKYIMDMKKGNIGVTTENIFPIIKKFLYSDHEIFLRELVSNAVDATQKLKTLSSKGDFKGELGALGVKVSLTDKTLTVSDRGIGMTAEEIDRYINQIALSGANDFLEKYKDDADAIIGHFGLGFYSSFMVADKVEIITRSYKEGAKAVKWTCDGTPNYTIEECEKDDRGTDIVLHISDDCEDFLKEARIEELLNKYCRFLPVPVIFGKKKEWKDGKQVDTDVDNVINDTEPIWKNTPGDLKDEDYKKFYRELYPMQDEPLFWIHLNVDFPFHLTGILYFPKIHNNVELQRNKIQLYCNQVYVTDSVEGIVPEFLTLLHGVIDSPDIPLNVSRSYLQSDQNVKKISTYITKKVADRLDRIFKDDRKEFEEKWDDLKLFINFGMLTDEQFYKRSEKFALLKDTDNKFFTFDEYRDVIKDAQTDKDGNLVYLYASNRDEQFSFIEAAQNKGYNVLMLDGEIDVALVNLLEQKMEKTRFTRVDSDVVERLIPKEDAEETKLSAGEDERLRDVFASQMPSKEKIVYNVSASAMGETSAPVVITQSEYMRRMKEMSRLQPGMAFYGQMPTTYDVTLNSDHRLIKSILEESGKECEAKAQPIKEDIDRLEKEFEAEHKAQNEKKSEEVTQEERDKLAKMSAELDKKREQRKAVYAEFAGKDKNVRQLVDLALLRNGLLKGEALGEFIKRSVDIM